MSKKQDAFPLLYSTELSSNIAMMGDLKTKASLLIKGRLSGSIVSSSFVCIERGAEVAPCAISAVSVAVRGAFSGKIEAESSMEIAPTARVRADIKAPNLSIAEAASFEGEIEMPEPGD